MKFTILVDNRTECPNCCAEWGLSILIESSDGKILFDAGASSMFAKNAEALGADLSDVKALVISHGHYDHTEGAAAFTARNKTAPIYLHEEAGFPCYGETDGVRDEENCGILWEQKFYDDLGDRLVYTKEVYPLSEHAWIVGNIPSMEEYGPTERFFRKLRIRDDSGLLHTSMEPDAMNHEQFLAVEEDGQLHIFSGCSHKGIIPILKYAAKVFPGKKIAGVTAGMHLYSASPKLRREIIDQLAAMDLDYIVPLHCTGIAAMASLKQKMGEKCKLISTGESLQV